MKFRICSWVDLFGLWMVALALVAQCRAAVPGSNASTNKPNVIVILTDDQGYADVGFNGSKEIPTPYMDSIANNGVRFSSGYVSYPVCSPSRAGLLTGRYGHRFGHERNPRWEPKNVKSGLPLSETTLADVLQRAGYRTGIIGKWHLGAHPDLHPLKRGFNDFYGFLGGGHRFFAEELKLTDPLQAKSESESYHLKILSNSTPVEVVNYLTDEFSEQAIRFVEKNQGIPFFLYLAYNAPHEPLQAPENYLERFKNIENKRRRTYAAMVSAVDDGIGRLLQKVRTLGLEQRTLIFFLSDNGGFPKANASQNGPLRGTKGTVWEGGWRVPFAVQWPGHLPKGQVYENPVISLDIFATVAALAGIPENPERPLDGVNLMPFLTGENTNAPHDALYMRMFDKGMFAVRRGDFKMVISTNGAKPALYDLRQDIGETRDVSALYPEQVQVLENLRSNWNSQLAFPVFEAWRPEKRNSSKKIFVTLLVIGIVATAVILLRRAPRIESLRTKM